MIKHTLKMLLRVILKQRAFSIINIAGLALGLACCVVITFWIKGELSYDRFHKDIDSIRMVLTHGSTVKNNHATPAPLMPALLEQCPEIISATRYEDFNGGLMSNGDNEFYEDDILAVDPSFFKMFTFPLKSGVSDMLFNDLYSMVITEEIAEKYFGDKNPIGEVLTLNRIHQFTVMGVMENVPSNSTLQFDMLVPFEVHMIDAKRRTGWDMDWGWYSPRLFIKLRNDCNLVDLENKMSEFFAGQYEDEGDSISAIPFTQRYFFFYGSEKYVYIFGIVALLILVMACINFVNLATARSAKRAKETGLRKVVGASRKNLIIQFLIESVVLSFISLIVAITLVEILFPVLDSSLGLGLMIDLFSNPYILAALIGFSILTGIIAGGYPAFLLSAYQPVKILRNNLISGSKSSILRRILVVVQFTCSVLLIIGTIAIYNQLHFLRNTDVGYNKENVVKIVLREDIKAKYEELRNELLRDDKILNVGGSAAAFPYWRWRTTAISWEGSDPDDEHYVAVNYVNHDFVETMGIEIVSGRNFSREFKSDAGESFLINEEMAKIMGMESVENQYLKYIDFQGNIIGVMKNFHIRPLNTRILPLIFMLQPNETNVMSIRIRPGDVTAALASIEATWKKMAPDYPFDYRFVDEDFNRRYAGVESVGNLAGLFAIIAIVIACLGLLGLAAFTAEQRMKEMGIRKVLGASILNIIQLLSREFLILVAISNAIAWPLAYLAMNSWLENYAYHIQLGWGIFVLAGGIALTIALLVVCSQTIRSAISNPIKFLRSE